MHWPVRPTRWPIVTFGLTAFRDHMRIATLFTPILMTETATSRQLEASLPLLESALAYIRNRHRLSAAEADELRSEVHLCLLRRDALRGFRGQSSLRTYFIAIAHNALRDLRDKSWQKWRPSIEARRLGVVALRLEELLFRDGMHFEDAVRALRTNHRIESSDQEIAALRDRLPLRHRRRFVPVDTAADLPAVEPNQLEVLETEQALAATRVGAALERALMELPAEDRLILKMHFYDGVKIADSARVLDLEQAPLYRRLMKLLGGLRATLSSTGFSSADIDTAVQSGCVPTLHGLAATEHAETRP